MKRVVRIDRFKRGKTCNLDGMSFGDCVLLLQDLIERSSQELERLGYKQEVERFRKEAAGFVDYLHKIVKCGITAELDNPFIE
jgi:hypothetical protein